MGVGVFELLAPLYNRRIKEKGIVLILLGAQYFCCLDLTDFPFVFLLFFFGVCHKDKPKCTGKAVRFRTCEKKEFHKAWNPHVSKRTISTFVF